MYRWMGPWSGRMSVEVAVTIVAPLSPTTTWRLVPVTTWFAVGETIVSWAVEDGRVTLVAEPEAAADGDALAVEGPAVPAAGAPDVQAPSATRVITATARRWAREACVMGDLIWRG